MVQIKRIQNKIAYKIVSGCICLSPRSGAKEHQRLPCLKYCNILKWKSRFSLGLNTAKFTAYIKECF